MKNVSKKLGIQTTGPLTREVCLKKVETLKRGIKENRYKGKLRRYAAYYINWYTWRANNPRRIKSKGGAKKSGDVHRPRFSRCA